VNYSQRHSTWVEVDLGAIRNHVRWFVENCGVEVMAVVKANAYGHGAVPVARSALQGGASRCAVARLEEALELRRAGLDCPILLLGFLPPSRAAEAVAARISLTVWDTDQVELAASAAALCGEQARLHLKVDTGMSRLGVQPQNALELAQQCASRPEIVFEGIFTHFARADEADTAASDEQERRFREVLSGLQAAGLEPALVHAANSAAGLARPSARFNLIRAGIAMYGLQPSADRPLPEAFRPALMWKAVLSQVKTVPAGQGVSYGHRYVTQREERLGTVPVGYADGFRRTPGNEVLVAGRRVPVVGRVCMDQLVVQLDGVPEAKTGDEVVLIGAQGNEQVSADEVAGRWGTINYEVVCGIGARVPRFYPGPGVLDPTRPDKLS
jgi:alanine racemase